MTLETRNEGDVSIVKVHGPVTFPDGTSLLRTHFRGWVAEGGRRFVIDMLAVDWLDSSGIGEVVACFKRAREAGGTVKLVLQARPHNQFTYCHLDRMFEIFDTVSRAVSSYDDLSSAESASA